MYPPEPSYEDCDGDAERNWRGTSEGSPWRLWNWAGEPQVRVDVMAQPWKTQFFLPLISQTDLEHSTRTLEKLGKLRRSSDLEAKGRAEKTEK